MRHTAAAAAVLALAGCAGTFPTIDEERRSVSSGFVGCAPAEITVTDHERYTWTATCRGRVYHCTVAPSASCAERR